MNEEAREAAETAKENTKQTGRQAKAAAKNAGRALKAVANEASDDVASEVKEVTDTVEDQLDPKGGGGDGTDVRVNLSELAQGTVALSVAVAAGAFAVVKFRRAFHKA